MPGGVPTAPRRAHTVQTVGGPGCLRVTVDTLGNLCGYQGWSIVEANPTVGVAHEPMGIVAPPAPLHSSCLVLECFGFNSLPERRLVLVGDLNIAPLDNDVWSHQQLLDVVSHTPIEVARLTGLYQTLNWVDAVRHFVPPEQKLYTWWSYRARDWALSDRGRRLDHIWVTPPLAPRLSAVQVLKEARGWSPKPSDHVPVIVDLAG